MPEDHTWACHALPEAVHSKPLIIQKLHVDLFAYEVSRELVVGIMNGFFQAIPPVFT